MEDSSDSSPFAAFAMPKRSAVEEFQERQRRAARTRRWMIGCVLAGLVGSIGGATVCAAFDGNLEVVLTSLIGALIGGSGGVVIGLIVGAMCFSAMFVTNLRGKSTIETQLARRDPMAAMRGLMFSWSLIGAALGASAGAREGVEWAGANLLQQSLARWTVLGSILGGGFGLAVWYFALRSTARTTAAG